MSLGPNATHPASNAVEVTPDDDNDIPATVRSLFIGGSGNIAVTMAGGAEVTFVGVPAGVLAIQAKRVKSTGTTATDIIALV